MSLKEFLNEEKQYRKEKRAEQKRQKKRPLTRGQKVYKIVSIIFVIALIFGALSYSCSGLGGVSGWGQLSDLDSSIKQKLQAVPSETEVLDDAKLESIDKQSFVNKLLAVGIDYNDDSSQTPTGDFELTSRELGAYAIDFCSELDNSQNFEILTYKIYFGGEFFYEQSVCKFYLNKYFDSTDLTVMYVKSVSKIQVLSGSLSVLSTNAIVNNLSDDESREVFDALNKKTLVYSFESIANVYINNAISGLSSVTSTKMLLDDGKIKFALGV